MPINSNQFKKVALLAAQTADEKKAERITLLDLRKTGASLSEFLLIVDGNSDVHLKALKEAIEEKIEESGLRPIHQEGFRGGRWIVLDYGGLMVHIFHEQVRDFYSLERLWEDSKTIECLEPSPVKKERKRVSASSADGQSPKSLPPRQAGKVQSRRKGRRKT